MDINPAFSRARKGLLPFPAINSIIIAVFLGNVKGFLKFFVKYLHNCRTSGTKLPSQGFAPRTGALIAYAGYIIVLRSINFKGIFSSKYFSIFSSKCSLSTSTTAMLCIQSIIRYSPGSIPPDASYSSSRLCR